MKKYILFITLTIILMIGIFTCSIVYINEKEIMVQSGYIAVFKGTDNDIVYSTYVYRHVHKNRKKNTITYKFINTKQSVNKTDGSTYEEKVTSSGTVKKKKELFKKAKKHKAYTYVFIEGTDEVMSIDDYNKKLDSEMKDL